MKRLFTIFAISLLALTACSKEEATPEAPAEETAVPEAVEAATEATEETAESTEAQTVVVEESAAEAEPENQAIVLARAEDIAEARSWKYKEGVHYSRLVPTQPTVGGADKIEVAEVFMYSCPHCFDLEPHLKGWAEQKDPNVRFVRIPAIFNRLAQLHAQLYYTEQYLAQSGKLSDPDAFHLMVFDEYHRKGNRLTSESAIERLFVRAGVSEDDFQRTWNSFEVNQALRVAADLARRYNISSVPTIVVNGKYVTSVGNAGGYPQLSELIDELTVREGLR